MASWGLAFEYGKNAYTEMMKKQEELDRYLAERNLWEMELKTKEATARANQAEAERTSENSIILSQYADDILSGNYGAYADALSKINPNKQFKYIGDGIIAEVDPSNPKLILPESARDISKIEPSKLVSELYKSAESIGMISANERKAEADKLAHDRNKEIKTIEGKNAATAATIKAQGAIAAAKVKAEGASSSTTRTTGGKGSRINLSDKDREYLDSTVAQTLFGSGVRGVRTEDGGWEVTDKTGAPIQLKKEDIRDLEEVHRVMLTDSSNLAQSNSGDLQANIATVASTLSNQINFNKGYNTALTEYNKGLDFYNKAKASAKKTSDELNKWSDVDINSLPEDQREAAESFIAMSKDEHARSSAVGMPTWDESKWGKRGDSLRPITYGLGLRYMSSSEESKSKK